MNFLNSLFKQTAFNFSAVRVKKIFNQTVTINKKLKNQKFVITSSVTSSQIYMNANFYLTLKNADLFSVESQQLSKCTVLYF